MSKVFAIAGAALLCLARPAAAQYEPTFPGCPRCGVTAYVDLPSPSVTVSNAELLAHNVAFEGWGFECVSGDPVDRVDIYVEDDVRTGIWRPVPGATPTSNVSQTWSGSNPRPDVEDAFVAVCPSIFGRWNGFVRWIDRPLPLGAHRFQFIVWKGPYHNDNLHNPLIKTLNVVE